MAVDDGHMIDHTPVFGGDHAEIYHAMKKASRPQHWAGGEPVGGVPDYAAGRTLIYGPPAPPTAKQRANQDRISKHPGPYTLPNGAVSPNTGSNI